MLVAALRVGVFQSTLPRGSDSFSPAARPSAYVFQSTLPRGSDSLRLAGVFKLRHFNPRSLAGATHFLDLTSLLNSISIHAPSRERRRLSSVSSVMHGFQSTLPRGSDRGEKFYWKNFTDFNPRSLAGATTNCLCCKRVPNVFQSTLPRGSDHLE